MKTKIEKSEKTIGFTVKNCKKEQKPFENQCFFEKKGRKTNSHLRIRAVELQYSSGDVMRNPYSQAV